MSIVVPPQDLAPSVASRVVTLKFADLHEGPVSEPGTVTFVLPGDLRVPADDVIIRAGVIEVQLDANGEGQVRLPTHDPDAIGDGVGSDWYLLVKKSWNEQVDMIRIPTGTGPISLADINPVVDVTPEMQQWLITNASVTASQGAAFGVSASVAAGILNLAFTFPPGGVAWKKGALTGTPATIDAMRTSADDGVYRVETHAAATALGLPEPAPGVLTVQWMSGSASAIATQTWEIRTPAGVRRYSRSINAGTTVWTSWDRDTFTKATLSNVNLDTLVKPGIYRVAASSRSTVTGLPPTTVASPVGILEVINTDETSASWPAHRYHILGSSPETWYRMASNVGPTWNAWVRTFPAPAGGGSGDGSTDTVVRGMGTPNELRLQAFRDAYPLASTGGKGVVVFRWDHGLTYLKETLLALHQQYGIPFYVAMNSRRWGITENAGATQADVKAWIQSGLCEIGNHTATHEDTADRAAIFDTIVNGRRELEDQLGITVHGFTVPGVAGTGLGGFYSGSLRQFTETYAGEVILANHAVSSGVVSGPHRKLDGVIRQGFDAYPWERAVWADIKAQIDAAIANKTALTLMAHPRVMNYPDGYFTPALAEQVIAYVTDRIAAGQLAPMSYYQSLHATL